MTGAELKARLEQGGRVYGTMFSLARSPRWTRALEGVGFDYVIVDTEHAPFSRGEVAEMTAALERSGIAPIVRIPVPESHYVTMAMDAGAHGVLAPYCETVDQVREVIGGVKWRPLKGALLRKALDTGEFPGEETHSYLRQRNANSIAVIGIESVPAIENLEAILDVPGIDAIFVGPNDLSITLGVPDRYDHPDFEAALSRILRTCQARNVPVAVHLMDNDRAARWMEAGVRFVLHSNDIRAMVKGFQADFTALRETGKRLEGS
ncbi:MAG: hypothetical protein IT210_20300 [Armatimonadetes bacterium]|nr:hypothetical protein [Armatimonadota bacterium]